LGLRLGLGGNKGFALRADSDRIADGVFKAGAVVEEVDLDAEEKDGDVARGEGGKTDRIFFRGDQGEPPAGAGAGEGVFHFGHVEAVVVGKGALIDDFGAEFHEALKEAFGHGDAGDGADAEAAQIGKGFGFPGDHVLEVQWVMGAGKNPGVAVVTADLLLQLRMVFALAFGEQDEVSSFEGVWWFPENATG